MRRPYVVHDAYDAVDMIGHHHEGVQFHVLEMVRDFMPTRAHDFPHVVQPHFPVHHVAEQRGAPVGADGDEIRARLGVIVSLQPDGTAVVALEFVIGHSVSSEPNFA